MNRIATSILVLGVLAGPLAAEDLLDLGLRSAFNAFAPIPEETARAARSAANELIGPYLKRDGSSHLCQRNAKAGEAWMELQGLKIQRVAAQAVTQADRANGIQEKLLVLVDCEMYRTRKPADTSWSPWVNGIPTFFPPAINVAHGTNGKWTATSFHLQYFNPIGSQRPVVEPRPAANPANAGLPPGMSRAGSSAIPQPGNSNSPVQPRITPVTPTLPPQAPPAVNPLNAGQPPVYQSPVPAAPPDAENRDSTKSNTPAKPFDNAMPFIIAAVVVVSVISQFSKMKKRPARFRKTNKHFRNPPPPASRPSTGSFPPPLPAPAQTSERNPIDLMQRRDNLMTPAELAFFAVLEPIVRPSYMLSSKVRLADLFDVRQERGQQAAFNKIVGKHIDFVVTDRRTSRILCGIELDDSSHGRPDRIERDRFVNELFAQHQLPLLRVPFSWTYYPVALRAELAKAGLVITESN